jgi:molecular chaperone GrpE
MSREPGQKQPSPEGQKEQRSEGWESQAEEAEATLAPNPELEAAMLEAAEAIPDADPPEAPAPPDEEEKPEDPELVLSNPLELPPQEELMRLQVGLTEANDRLLRLQAEFENFRKRAAREHQEAMLFGPQILVKDLLSVVDNLDRAIDHARQSEGGDLQGLLQGVELVQRELLGVLGKHHVTPVDAMGEYFNPAFHEAMAQIPDGGVEPNTIIDVLQKGYQLRDRLLRPAKVVVTRAADEPGEGGQGEATE